LVAFCLVLLLGIGLEQLGCQPHVRGAHRLLISGHNSLDNGMPPQPLLRKASVMGVGTASAQKAGVCSGRSLGMVMQDKRLTGVDLAHIVKKLADEGVSRWLFRHNSG
jgi:hypothetical protein